MPTKKKITPKAKYASTKSAGSDSSTLEGRKAPDFELADDSGKMVKLKDLIGSKKLVLYFYPKDLTPGCTTEACSFRDNAAALRSAGAEPSPYFDVRLQARLREEMAKPQAGWLHWFRRPVLAALNSCAPANRASGCFARHRSTIVLNSDDTPLSGSGATSHI